MWAVGPEVVGPRIALAALVQQHQGISIVTYGSRGSRCCDPDVTTLCSVQPNCTERRSRSRKADCSCLHHVVALKFSQAGLWLVFFDSCFLSCFCLFVCLFFLNCDPLTFSFICSEPCLLLPFFTAHDALHFPAQLELQPWLWLFNRCTLSSSFLQISEVYLSNTLESLGAQSDELLAMLLWTNTFWKAFCVLLAPPSSPAESKLNASGAVESCCSLCANQFHCFFVSLSHFPRPSYVYNAAHRPWLCTRKYLVLGTVRSATAYTNKQCHKWTELRLFS